MQFQKPYQMVKSEKYETFCASKLLIWRQKWTAGVRHGTSLVIRPLSSGGPIAVLFWTKYASPRQIKPGILKLTTSRGHSNLLTVFSFVNCEERGYYRVVSVGQINFDCSSYCGRSCRMQGSYQPRSQGLSSYRLGRARRDPGRVWSRVSQNLGDYNLSNEGRGGLVRILSILRLRECGMCCHQNKPSSTCCGMWTDVLLRLCPAIIFCKCRRKHIYRLL